MQAIGSMRNIAGRGFVGYAIEFYGCSGDCQSDSGTPDAVKEMVDDIRIPKWRRWVISALTAAR